MAMTKHERKVRLLQSRYELARQDYCDYMLEMWGIKNKAQDVLLDGDTFVFTLDGNDYSMLFEFDVLEAVEFSIPLETIKEWHEWREKENNNKYCELLHYVGHIRQHLRKFQCGEAR